MGASWDNSAATMTARQFYDLMHEKQSVEEVTGVRPGEKNGIMRFAKWLYENIEPHDLAEIMRDRSSGAYWKKYVGREFRRKGIVF